ncbi:MAG: 3-hydroxybutyryl-CoA dehydrogenase [Bdellovibrionaceae bacterium]|nr:3-hydroxybutyryl-CoA dehydrogenase [Pseudobdellovibrionaceae bacterium]
MVTNQNLIAHIKSIGVLGAGQMGNGIAQVAAVSGYQITLCDISDESVKKAMKTISTSLEKLTAKNVITEELKNSALARIHTTTQINDLKNVDVFIEAATENIDLKMKIFKDVDAFIQPEAYLFSNTSSISITKLAGATKRPEKVAGMHFMNPVPLMKLVEGIRGLQTTDQTFETMKQLTEKMGKTFVPSVKDMPGFIVNRILMPMINEAIYTLHEGIADVESIDQAMKLGTNQPMGPLTLADFIGLDTCLAIMHVLHDGLGDSKYRPCPLLTKYVEAGWLGKKSGRGFYNYGI